MDYPSDTSYGGRATQCELMRAADTANAHIQRTRHPKLFFAGVVQTKVKPNRINLILQANGIDKQLNCDCECELMRAAHTVNAHIRRTRHPKVISQGSYKPR